MVIIGIALGLMVCVAAGARLAQSPRVHPWMRSVPVVTIIVVAVAASSIFWVRGSAPGTESFATQLVEIGLLVLVLCVLGLGAFLFGVNLAGFDPDATAIANRLAVDSTSQQLLDRWTHRIRWRRWIGGVVGLVFALLSGNVDWLLPIALGGVALGSISAELHLCRSQRRHSGSSRVVSLDRRTIRDYIDRRTVYGLATVVAATLFSGAWLAMNQGSGAVLWWTGAALGTVVVAAALISIVVHRRRPALSPELRGADDLLRRIAVSNGIAQPMIAFGFALLASQLAAVESDLALPTAIVAVVVWWRNRRGGLDYVLKNPVKKAHLLAQPQPS